MKEKSHYILIPIYKVGLEIVVTDSIEKSLKDKKRWQKLGRPSGDYSDSGACFFFNGNQTAIIFARAYLTSNSFAHEVFHATCNILDRAGVKYKSGTNNEAFSYLNGFISELIFNQLLKWKIKIK